MPEMAGHPTKRKQLESCIESRATCYYGFEPNPLFTTQLNTLEAEQRAAGYQVITLPLARSAPGSLALHKTLRMPIRSL